MKMWKDQECSVNLYDGGEGSGRNSGRVAFELVTQSLTAITPDIDVLIILVAHW